MNSFRLCLIFFTKSFFSFTLYWVLSGIVLSATRCLFMTSPKYQKLLRKAFKRFCMPSTTVIKLMKYEIKMFVWDKPLTVFLMNLNCIWKEFRWWQKLFSRRLKKVLFCLGRTDQFWTCKRRSFYIACRLGSLPEIVIEIEPVRLMNQPLTQLTTKPLTEIHPAPFVGTAAENVFDRVLTNTSCLEWSQTAASNPCLLKRHSFVLLPLLAGPN